MLTASCTMVARYDYWTVPESLPVRQSCGRLLWKAGARHVDGDLAFVARPVSPIEWDDVRLHLCTLPARMSAISAGPILPIIPTPMPYRLEGTTEDEVLGVVVLNREDSRPIRLDIDEIRLRAGQQELALQSVVVGSGRCTPPENPLPPTVDLEPDRVATLCFQAPEATVESLRLDVSSGGSELALERDRGTFLFVLE